MRGAAARPRTPLHSRQSTSSGPDAGTTSNWSSGAHADEMSVNAPVSDMPSEDTGATPEVPGTDTPPVLQRRHGHHLVSHHSCGGDALATDDQTHHLLDVDRLGWGLGNTVRKQSQHSAERGCTAHQRFQSASQTGATRRLHAFSVCGIMISQEDITESSAIPRYGKLSTFS